MARRKIILLLSSLQIGSIVEKMNVATVTTVTRRRKRERHLAMRNAVRHIDTSMTNKIIKKYKTKLHISNAMEI